VEFYGKVGEVFNPHRHEALRQVPVESESQDEKIVSVERSGYSIGDTIIRAAQVTVGAFREAKESNN
jgi:molecular chaperone GrpE (heat shock protein)